MDVNVTSHSEYSAHRFAGCMWKVRVENPLSCV